MNQALTGPDVSRAREMRIVAKRLLLAQSAIDDIPILPRESPDEWHSGAPFL
jgi:hypothetical protein